ncbi:VWA domain-containing protein [Flavobacteriaceae bacterium]|nr:VWA domain-containing protein [Flavobacteriaceae bacterium]MDB4182815.1 VWA domain-containing protein [Flavobacteriaceae bacterium]
MPAQTILYIIGSGILALFVALFQYIYKTKRHRLHWGLACLRFISIFSLLLLIINPKFENTESSIVKPTLVVAVDNSQSVKYLGKDSVASKAVQSILNNKEIASKYEIKLYNFGAQLNQNTTLTFDDHQTNITKSLQGIEAIYDSQLAPIVLISDGNQTIGTDYQYASKAFEQVVFPLILGDRMFHTDLKIQQINVNKYTYLNNKFPVEIIASYSGSSPIQTVLTIRSGAGVIHKEVVRFTQDQNIKIITPKITATQVGVQRYQVGLSPLKNEKNTINNQKYIAIESIDERTKIALISSISHPDLGAIKASIETNEQRLVTICSPSDFLRLKDDYDLAILYQPTSSFKAAIDFINLKKLNTFIIGGNQTQWSFLNAIQSGFKQEITGQIENYQGRINPSFANFITTDFNFNSYPPLSTEFGSININVPHETFVFKSINGIDTQEPLWFTYENNAGRSSVLLAENIWKWRMHSYRDTQNFENFDALMAKMIQYLNIQNQNKRLVLNYESIYDGSQPLELSAQFFNKNYESDPNAQLNIRLTETTSERQIEYPMVSNQNTYKINLSALEPGVYNFEVSANKKSHRAFGSFEILKFNIEQQFINANVEQLEQLALHTDGATYFDTQTNDLIAHLISDNRFSSIQKFTKKSVPLIDLKFWLLLLVLSLTIEWIIRKYNGLI